MLNFKKISASILSLSSTLVFAGSINPTTALKNWGTPGCENGFEVGASVLYLKQSFGGNGLGYSAYSNYAGADNSGIIRTNNGPNHITNINPKWGFGFEVDAGYHFCANNDVNLNWTHLNNDVDGHLPAGSLYSGSVDGFYADHIQRANRWDAVNLELGREISISDKKQIRLHAGVAYARIKNTFTNYPKLFADSAPYFISTDEIKYSGWGPRLGADFAHAINCGFGVYAKAASSLLIGSSKQTISGYRDYSNAVYGLIPFGIPNYNAFNRYVLVPEVEAKLGVTYDYAIGQGNIGLDLGYLWMSYLNAITSYTGIGVVGSSLGIPATTNFSVNGLYLKLNYAF